MSKRTTRFFRILGASALVIGLGLTKPYAQDAGTVVIGADAGTGGETTTCVTGGTTTDITGTLLSTKTTLSGVSYDTTTSSVKLSKTGGGNTETKISDTSSVFFGCAADFNADGWTDYVGTAYGSGTITLYTNRTTNNAAPSNWTTTTRTPSFTSGSVETTNSNTGVGAIACGDVNSDGKMDFIVVRCASGTSCTNPGRADLFLGTGSGTFSSATTIIGSGSDSLNKWGGDIVHEGTWMQLYDLSGDGKVDLVYGVGTNKGGKVVYRKNDGGTTPKFTGSGSNITTDVTGLTDLALAGKNTSAGPTAISIADFSNDGKVDMIIGSISSSELRLYLQGASGFSSTYTALPGFTGGAVVTLAGNFALNGRYDLVVATDNTTSGTVGGSVFLYQNNGATDTPFAANPTTVATGSTSTDFDGGIALDYDHDPSNTLDFLLFDGNGTAKSALYSTRVSNSTYTQCGTVTSNALDLGANASTDLSITGMTIAPTPSSPTYGTVTWEASINNGVTWQTAEACPDDATKFCATFTTSSGSKMKWRATMCAGTDSSGAYVYTPSLSTVKTSYSYEVASPHFRAGPIAAGGVIYAGAFTEPGKAGHFFAIQDSDGTTLWDAQTQLDAQASSSRYIYVVNADGTDTRIDNTDATLSSLLDTLNVTDTTQALALYNWFVSKRFGATSETLHVLGGVENSTPALLNPPGQPYYYPYLTSTEKTAFDSYISTYSSRTTLVLFGSRDGALHAITAATGNEAWALVPYDVAQRLVGDYTSGNSTAYVDGSPTLASAKINGAYKTVLVMGEGEGGNGVFALDVTDTVPSSGTVGPTRLWRFTDSKMGPTKSKPAVIRTKVNGNETWMAVFASGRGDAGTGGTVYALDLYSGARYWTFDVGDDAYISSDITAADIDDEDGTTVDGYVDRVYFADSKGRVWKVNPGNFTDSGSINTVNSHVTVDGASHAALFSTKDTQDALGTEMPIATLVAATDASKRLVLFFGTGGTEDTPAGSRNAIYAIYADDGSIRTTYDLGSGFQATGGIVLTNGQLLFAKGTGNATDVCAASGGQIVALDANTFAVQFTTDTTSVIVAPLYATGGEVYSVTLTGQVITSAYQGSAENVTGSGNHGNGNGNGNGNNGSGGNGSASSTEDVDGTMSDPFTIVGWSQVY